MDIGQNIAVKCKPHLTSHIIVCHNVLTLYSIDTHFDASTTDSF